MDNLEGIQNLPEDKPEHTVSSVSSDENLTEGKGSNLTSAAPLTFRQRDQSESRGTDRDQALHDPLNTDKITGSDDSDSGTNLAADDQPNPDEEKERPDPFLVIGIGASAGGVVALQQFFEKLPDGRTGLAFVVVTHLSPDHESHLASIIQATTHLDVIQVTEPVPVRPDNVYVIPPGKQLTMDDGHIRLSEIEPSRSRRAPIDLFFRTLAQTHMDWSAAVVLSGTGADGAIGLPRIKELGGVTLAQEPIEAEYGEMPKKAIATGFVDQVLPVGQIGEWLVNFQQRKRQLEKAANQTVNAEPATTKIDNNTDGVARENQKVDGLGEILHLLRLRTGHNFAQYKFSTLNRRVVRRMQVNGLTGMDQYLAFLRESPLEAETLKHDFLISVTNFFRDHKVWDYVEANIIPALFRDKDKPAIIVRVWVAGCATGEEAYTLAILLHEYAAKLHVPVKLQIFASDLDGAAIAVAREAIYPETIALDVSPERLTKFFTPNGSNYQVKKSVRETILFATHNALEDPPFSKLDLVTCRNLMIYLNREAQQQLLNLFHFALKPERFLVLGTSETADSAPDLFSSLSKNNHLYTRRPQIQYALPLPLPQLPVEVGNVISLTRKSAPTTGESALTSSKNLLPAELHQGILELYSPPSVVINENFGIIHISKRAGRFLEIKSGEFTSNLLQLVLPDLRMELRTSLHEAVRYGRTVQTRWIPLGLSSDTDPEVEAKSGLDQRNRLVRVSVRPVLEPPSFRGYILVVFEESSEKSEYSGGEANSNSNDNEQTRKFLTRNGESHLESISNNPSNSQSSATVRAPVEIIEGTITESEAAVADAARQYQPQNQIQRDEVYHRLLEELEIQKKYSQTSFEQYEITVEELKASNEELQAMNEELRSATEELETSKEELQAVNEELLSVNHELKLKVEETSLANNNLQNLIGSTNIATIFLDRALQVKFYTPQVEQLINILPMDLNRPLAHFTHHLNYPDLYKDSEKVLRYLTPIHREVETTGGEWFLVSQTPYRTVENYIDGVVLTFIDITERKQNEEKLSYQASLLEFTQEAVIALNSEEEITFWNPGAQQMYGWMAEEVLGKSARDILGEIAWADNNINQKNSPSGPGSGLVAERKAAALDDSQSRESMQRHKNGTNFWVESSSRPFFDKENRLAGYITVLRNISNRKIAEQALRESEGRFRSVAELVPDLLWQTDAQGEFNWVNQRWLEHTGQTFEASLGQGWLASIHPEDQASTQSNFERAKELGQPARWEFRIKNQSGEHCWYLAHILPVKNEAGRIMQWLGAASDVHEQRLAQETLENRVQERTAQLEKLNNSLHKEQRRLAKLSTRLLSVQENERRFIARELHDEIGQELTGLNLILETARLSTADQKDKQLASAHEVLKTLTRHVSDLSLNLRPAMLDEQGLLATLQWHIQRYTSQTGVEVEFIHKGLDKRYTSVVETTVYRLIQEALTNVARYSGVKKARVQIVADGQMNIIIEDEGKGFEVDQVLDQHTSTGVAAMQERVELVGGRFTIESRTGNGTTLVIEIPLGKGKVKKK